MAAIDPRKRAAAQAADRIREGILTGRYASGTSLPGERELSEQLGVALDSRGNVAVNADFATNVPGIYCAGDARKGASLIVWAIADGRETARSVDRYLTGESQLPTKGQDTAFGGR